MAFKFTIETEQADDGRWIAEVTEIPGVMLYGSTDDEAIAKVHALALRVLAERVDDRHTDYLTYRLTETLRN